MSGSNLETYEADICQDNRLVYTALNRDNWRDIHVIFVKILAFGNNRLQKIADALE